MRLYQILKFWALFPWSITQTYAKWSKFLSFSKILPPLLISSSGRCDQLTSQCSCRCYQAHFLLLSKGNKFTFAQITKITFFSILEFFAPRHLVLCSRVLSSSESQTNSLPKLTLSIFANKLLLPSFTFSGAYELSCTDSLSGPNTAFSVLLKFVCVLFQASCLPSSSSVEKKKQYWSICR